jgi:nitrate/nitrite transporter NarK
MVRASKNDCVCILFLSYADGVEPFMSSDLATYTQDEFSMDKRKAGLMAGLFCLMKPTPSAAS